MKSADSLKEATTKHLVGVSSSTRVSNACTSHKIDDVLRALSDYLDTALNDYSAATAISDLRQDLSNLADESEVRRILDITGTSNLLCAAQTIQVFDEIFRNTTTLDEDDLKDVSVELDKLSMAGADILEVLRSLLPILKDYSVPEVEEALCEVNKLLRGDEQ